MPTDTTSTASHGTGAKRHEKTSTQSLHDSRRLSSDPPSSRLVSNPSNTFEERVGLHPSASSHNLARAASFADTAASSSELSRRASMVPDDPSQPQQQRRSRAQSLHDAVNAFRDYSSEVFTNEEPDPKAPPANDNWMNEWMSVVEQMDKRGGVAVTEANRSIFGPPLKINHAGDFDELASAIKDVLLKTETDYAEAVAFADRTNFLSDPQDCCIRNVTSLMATAASCYTVLRSLFHSLDFQLAVEKMTSYTSMMRSLRSIVYLAESTGQNADQMQQQSIAMNAMKLKYESTIRTLRRQLADFHGENNTVGRGVDGQFAVQTKSTASTGPKVGPSAKGKFIILVQFEDPGLFRKKPMVLRDALHVAKAAALDCAPAFRCTRSNYFQADEEAEERKQGPVVNRCYMFTAVESYDALAFALTLHQSLNAPSTAWPLAVVTSAKYGSELWRGLRARIAVHHGFPEEMDLGESVEQKAKHYEGIVVEKCLRVAGLGVAGDTVISSSAWELFSTDQKASQIPSSSEYDTLRGTEVLKQPAPPRYGFKKAEYVMRVWSKKLAARRTTTCDADFDRPAFYQVEALEGGDGYDDQNAPLTSDELLQVKETELIVLQQELDTVRLGIIKRDADIAELQQRLYYTIAKMQEKSKLKEVVLRETVRQLECNCMQLHDGTDEGIGFDSLSQPPDTPSTQSLMSELSARRRGVLQGAGFVTADNLVQQFLTDVANKREAKKKAARDKIVSELTGTPITPAEGALQPQPQDHKNVKLWRDLMQTVESTSIPTVTVTPPHRASSGIFKSDSGGAFGGGINAMLRAHNTVKVFHALLKRFATEEDRPGDVDNKGLSEEQFMKLFVTKVQSDGLTSAGGAQSSGWKLANPREQMTWLSALAIEADDVEVANRFDDARLARSVAGHLASIYVVVRNLKRHSRFDSNNAATTQPGSAGGAAGGGTLAPPGASRQRRKSIGATASPMLSSASNRPRSTTTIAEPATAPSATSTKALQDENQHLKEQLAKLQATAATRERPALSPMRRGDKSPNMGPLDMPRSGRRKSFTAFASPEQHPATPPHPLPAATIGGRATAVPSLKPASASGLNGSATDLDLHGSPLVSEQPSDGAVSLGAAAAGDLSAPALPSSAVSSIGSDIVVSPRPSAEQQQLEREQEQEQLQALQAAAAMDPVTEPTRHAVSPGRRATLQPSIQNFGGMMFGTALGPSTQQGHHDHATAGRPGSQAVQRMAAQVPERWRQSVSQMANQLAAVGSGQTRPGSSNSGTVPHQANGGGTAVPFGVRGMPSVTPPPVLSTGAQASKHPGVGGPGPLVAQLPAVARPFSPGVVPQQQAVMRQAGAPLQREELERQLEELRSLQRAAVALRGGGGTTVPHHSGHTGLGLGGRGTGTRPPTSTNAGAAPGALVPSGSTSGMAVVRTMQLAVRSTSPRASRR